MPGSGRFSSGAAYRNRTDELRITRGMPPACARATCTDSTANRTDGCRGAGIIRQAVPRTVPRPKALYPVIRATVHNVNDGASRNRERMPTGRWGSWRPLLTRRGCWTILLHLGKASPVLAILSTGAGSNRAKIAVKTPVYVGIEVDGRGQRVGAEDLDDLG
jgi:hypothetical protein